MREGSLARIISRYESVYGVSMFRVRDMGELGGGLAPGDVWQVQAGDLVILAEGPAVWNARRPWQKEDKRTIKVAHPTKGMGFVRVSNLEEVCDGSD
jgi:hypothetical protein